MIEVQGLSKVFGETTAVDDLSFQVAAGETLALLGTSGSGKTTTLKMLNRLIEPSEGKILLKGEDVRKLPLEAMRRRMGYVIQDVGLFPHYTIAENVAVVPRLLKWPEERIKARSQLLLERLGLLPEIFLSRYPNELSGGQQQRVGIARAIVNKPKILLADEPTGNLDPALSREIMQLFLDFNQVGVSVLIASHDLALIRHLQKPILTLKHGRLVQNSQAVAKEMA